MSFLSKREIYYLIPICECKVNLYNCHDNYIQFVVYMLYYVLEHNIMDDDYNLDVLQDVDNEYAIDDDIKAVIGG